MEIVDKRFYTLTLFLCLTVFISCKETIRITDIVDKAQPLELQIKNANKLTGPLFIKQEHIQVNSDKQKMLFDWANKNVDGWKSTFASYSLNVYVGQKDFRLLYNLGTDFVVIGFNDKSNRPKQYVKTIRNGELDFLNN